MSDKSSQRIISIIIPTKNRATTFMPLLLASIEAQELPSGMLLECIVADDGSEPVQRDALRQLLSTTTLDVTLVQNEQSGGPAAARNAAVRLAQGEYIIDVDDDDVLPAGSLMARIELMDKTGAPWAGGNAIVIDESGTRLDGEELIRSWDHDTMSRKELMQAMLDNQAWLWAGTRTYRREALFNRAGALRAWDERYIIAQDLDHWLKLIYEVGAPAYMDLFVIEWRKKQDSHAINAKRSGLQAEMIAQIRAKWQPVIEEMGDD